MSRGELHYLSLQTRQDARATEDKLSKELLRYHAVLVKLPGRRSFSDALCDANNNKKNLANIAEIEQTQLNDLPTVADQCEKVGADCLSVTTDPQGLGGGVKKFIDLEPIKQATRLPVFYKDLIVGEYQVYKSASIGADAILLVEAVFDNDLDWLAALMNLAMDEFNMDVVLRLGGDEDLDKSLSSIYDNQGTHLVFPSGPGILTQKDIGDIRKSIRSNAPSTKISPNVLRVKYHKLSTNSAQNTPPMQIVSVQ